MNQWNKDAPGGKLFLSFLELCTLMNHFKTCNDPHPPILELVFSVGENSEKLKNSSYLLENK